MAAAKYLEIEDHTALRPFLVGALPPLVRLVYPTAPSEYIHQMVTHATPLLVDLWMEDQIRKGQDSEAEDEELRRAVRERKKELKLRRQREAQQLSASARISCEQQASQPAASTE